jgi:tetraacyldisaccharide 4'-kinase
LIPGSSIVAALARRRRARYAARPDLQRRLVRPVISVGNLSVGGTGKTPLVGHVARELLAAGERPSILSRGYARPQAQDGVTVVSNREHVLAGYDHAGDEPLMLARQLPGCVVLVSPDRYLAGALAERRLGCTVHILDDGFQHLQLARSLDIVVVAASDLDDRVLPGGRLREPIDALRLADVAVIADHEPIEQEVRRAGAGRIFRMLRRLGEPRSATPWGAPIPAADVPVSAFAGIGRPSVFFDELERAGWHLVTRTPFPDHHRYSRRDLERLGREASRSGAALLLTTEKDAIRIEGLGLNTPPVAWVPLHARVEPMDRFADLLRQVI